MAQIPPAVARKIGWYVYLYSDLQLEFCRCYLRNFRYAGVRSSSS